MRFARLQSYNAYRQRFGLPPKKDWADLTADVDVQERLAALYGDIEDLEWYVGIWAEAHPEDQMMGDLLTTMVGYDAFTQALTNPLLAPQVFTEATFTRAGLRIISKTTGLQQILARNVASPSAAFARFTYGPERRSRHARAPFAPRTGRRRPSSPAIRRLPAGYGLVRRSPPKGGPGHVRVKGEGSTGRHSPQQDFGPARLRSPPTAAGRTGRSR
jgi:hypothetical protein